MTHIDDAPVNRPRSRRRTVWIVVALVAAVGLVIGLVLFQPWKIFTRTTVNEAAPVAAAAALPSPTSAAAPTAAMSSPAASSPAASSPAAPSPAAPSVAGSPVPPTVAAPPKVVTAPASSAAAAGPTTEAAAAAPTEPIVLSSGTFVDGEHATTGTASVLRLPDGSRYVRLEGFSTSDGPDVQVWVTDQQAGGDWGKYDDGRYVELGTLKGTDGNQNYAVPADADLGGLTSVVIWCDRFNVAFGSAPVQL